jgi:hypothetical protein
LVGLGVCSASAADGTTMAAKGAAIISAARRFPNREPKSLTQKVVALALVA